MLGARPGDGRGAAARVAAAEPGEPSRPLHPRRPDDARVRGRRDRRRAARRPRWSPWSGRRSSAGPTGSNASSADARRSSVASTGRARRRRSRGSASRRWCGGSSGFGDRAGDRRPRTCPRSPAERCRGWSISVGVRRRGGARPRLRADPAGTPTRGPDAGRVPRRRRPDGAVGRRRRRAGRRDRPRGRAAAAAPCPTSSRVVLAQSRTGVPITDGPRRDGATLGLGHRRRGSPKVSPSPSSAARRWSTCSRRRRPTSARPRSGR